MKSISILVFTQLLCAQEATVHIYRPRLALGLAAHIPVYCDGADLAHMQNGRVLTLHIPAGKHRFDSNAQRGSVDAELMTGEEYFFRVEIVADGAFSGAHVEVSQIGAYRGKKETEKLKPLDRRWTRESACGTDVPK